MTFIKKCNRCGNEIGEEGSDNEFTFTKQRNTQHGYDKLMHFCYGCLKDFDEFMLNKKQEEQNVKENKGLSW